MLSTLVLSLAVVAAAEHTNVIFVLSDDQGWGDVGFNKPIQPGAGGNTYLANPPHTPELDAMANSPNSLVFSRFYSGSAVCSPTRSSALTGRTPDRECIYGAEGCGSDPAWECVENMPMPPPTFTVAEAAKALNYSTIHVGKWHLGDFFPKAEAKKKQTFAHKKWPASHPGIHGYDEWFSTEASASSSTTNCGCEPQWKNEGKGCIVGGGEYEHQALSCTNYWYPTDLSKSHQPTNPECHDATTSKLSCVANLTSKVPDDDTKEILDVFEDFLKRKTSSGEASPFLANLWLHTNHVPHPALPEWYHAYNGTDGQWAGDYLGTISQMDAQIGRLRQMLKHYGVANNTMLWFTADNGPHTQSEAPTRSSNQATGGLRQCKASLFEGGIRVPGIVEWPQGITSNMVTDVPAYTSDYLPTILDVFGMQHPQPTWHSDGVSLLPLIKNQMTTRPKPMGFRLGTQVAWIDNDMKLVYKPAQGQCLHFLPPYGKMRHPDGPFLFNITADPTESHDLSKEDPKTFQEMHAAMNAWQQTIADSQKHESGCVKA